MHKDLREDNRYSWNAATFQRADILDWLPKMAKKEERFDIVYCSYGVVHWIANLRDWTTGIAAVLKTGGRFILVDFHPITFMFDRDWNRTSSYFVTERIDYFDEGVIDYVALSAEELIPGTYQPGIENFNNPYPSHTFIWELGEIVTAVAQGGLYIEMLREYPHTIGKRFNRMTQITERRMIPPEDVPNMPLLYGLVARKA